jgi:hypothetical protein
MPNLKELAPFEVVVRATMTDKLEQITDEEAAAERQELRRKGFVHCPGCAMAHALEHLGEAETIIADAHDEFDTIDDMRAELRVALWQIQRAGQILCTALEIIDEGPC